MGRRLDADLMLRQQLAQPHGFRTKIITDQLIRLYRIIAFIKQEIEHRIYGFQPCGKCRTRRDLKGNGPLPDKLPGPVDPFLDRRLGGEQARAISCTPKPDRVFSVSATWSSGFKAG